MLVCVCLSLLYRTGLLRFLRFRPAEARMAAAAPSPEESSRSGGPGGPGSGLSAEGDSEEAEEFSSSTHCSELSRRQNEQRKLGLFCDVTLVFSGATGGETRTVFNSGQASRPCSALWSCIYSSSTQRERERDGLVFSVL